jgi:hypothetical protein
VDTTVNYCIVRFWSSSDVDETLSDRETTKFIQERFNITARRAQCAAKQEEQKKKKNATVYFPYCESRLWKIFIYDEEL